MKGCILFICMVLTGIVLTGIGNLKSQTVPVRMKYVETESPAFGQTVKISGAFKGKACRLRMAHSVDGKITYTDLTPVPLVLEDTVRLFSFAAEPLHKHTVSFTVEAGDTIVQEATVQDVLHSILLETYSARPYTTRDTIPLTAYSNGHVYDRLVDGKMVQGGSYCEVRDAKLPPADWHETFKMQDYIWFELLFDCR